MGLFADDVFVGTGTLALAVATFTLAFIAWRQLARSHDDRRLAAENLRVAQATLATQHRPELIATALDPDVRDSLPTRVGPTNHVRGEVIVVATGQPPTQVIVSVQVSNVGRGPAEIRGWRLMALHRLSEQGQAQYWVPPVWDQGRRVVAAGGDLRIHSIVDDPPEWLVRAVKAGSKLWVEVVYCDLARSEEHTRWLELEQQQARIWIVASVRMDAPEPFRNIPANWVPVSLSPGPPA